MLNIVICGGGNLATVCAGFFASQEEVKVSVLTRKPQAWSLHPEVTDCKGQCFTGQLVAVSHRPEDVIPQADLILLCLPGFAIEEVLQQIGPCLQKNAVVGSVVANTGFFFMAHHCLPEMQPLFGFQRVPFIARTENYGQKAQLRGYKPQLHVAIEHTADPEALRRVLEQLFHTPVSLLHNFYEASLSNSNPILHTGRLYTLWKEWDGKPSEKPIFFYDEWTDEASEMILRMDEELMRLTRLLGVAKEAIPPLLTYYESSDAASLTRKIRSIEAFHGILAPMRETPAGWVPDFTSRYFTEDFPFGLRFIHDLLHQHHINAPYIDEVFEWGMNSPACREVSR